jgi:hypothetical protein
MRAAEAATDGRGSREMTISRRDERPNRNIPKPERLGEEIKDDAAIGGASDDEYETKADDEDEESSDEKDAGPRSRRI